jgi:threonine synthase
LAGFYAKELGLPINQLIIATNENDILYRFMQTGTYEKLKKSLVFLDVKQTLSPAMDILISSNFERLLHHLLIGISGSFNQASEMIIQFMADLKTKGSFSVPLNLLQSVQSHFVAYRSTDSETLDAIRRYYYQTLESGSEKKAYVLDPHTAVGVIAAEQSSKDPKIPIQTIVLGTASPGKFPTAVLSAINESSPSNTKASGFQGITFKDFAPEKLTTLEDLPKRCIQIKTHGDFEKSIAQVRKVIESILQ